MKKATAAHWPLVGGGADGSRTYDPYDRCSAKGPLDVAVAVRKILVAIFRSTFQQLRVWRSVMEVMLWGAIAIGVLVVINFILEWRSRRASQQRRAEIASAKPTHQDQRPSS